MMSLSLLCILILNLFAVATARIAVRRKRALISIDLDDDVMRPRRIPKGEHAPKAGKKGDKKMSIRDADFTQSFERTDVDTFEMSMSMSFTYSPFPPPVATPIPTHVDGPSHNTNPNQENSSSPLPSFIQSPTEVGPSLPSQSPTSNSVPVPTTAPDCLVGVSREDYLVTTLSVVTDPTLLLDPFTPQGMALSWMTNVDTSLDVCTYTTLLQRYAMAVLYYSTNGPSWTLHTDWLTNERECLWANAVCNPDSVLTGLELSQNNLVGSITAEFSTLSSLENVILFNNSLTGTLPSLVGFSNLLVFDVEVNSFEGPAFGDLTDVTKLKDYLVSANLLTGTIPEEVGDLASLQNLWIIKNNIVGAIPSSIGKATSLLNLWIGGNRLTGTIPTAMKGLVNLESFYANENELIGTVPADLIQSSNFTKLHLYDNNLGGFVPNLPLTLRELWLQNNTFSGTIPSVLVATSSLELLLVGNNRLTGTIPAIGTKTLRHIDIRFNELTGTIPASLFLAPDSLEFVYLQGNKLMGAIPSSFSSAPKLHDLYLSSNVLTGTIPDVPVGSLVALEELLLDGNKFVGTMPESVCNLRNGSLEDLWADCATLVCSLPDCCTQCFPGL